MDRRAKQMETHVDESDGRDSIYLIVWRYLALRAVCISSEWLPLIYKKSHRPRPLYNSTDITNSVTVHHHWIKSSFAT